MKISAHISFIPGMFLLLVSLVSCTEDRDDRQNCLSYETAYVTAIDGPSNAQTGQEVEVQLEFQVHNGCGQFINSWKLKRKQSEPLRLKLNMKAAYARKMHPF